MSEWNDDSKEIRSPNPLRRLYDIYAAGVAYITVIDKQGNEGIGTCFHIGDNVFITAKHVVEGYTIKEISTTVYQRRFYEMEDSNTTGMARVDLSYFPQKTDRYEGPFLHPDEKIDVAALVVSGINAPVLLLGDHLDDWLGDEYILSEAVVMGYPPVPFAAKPLLIVSKCEVNAVVDKYTGGHPQFILSSMARGGFSGGPAITEDGIVLGVVTESLISDGKPAELGYLSVLSVEGIYNCISHHRIVPKHIDEIWDGFWNTESKHYSESPSDHIDISIYRGYGSYYFKIFSYRSDIINNTISLIAKEFGGFHSLNWIHDSMIKIEFKEGTISEELANHIFKSLTNMVESLNIKQYGKSSFGENG
ncbi:MAG: serine protease [Flavobacterium sp.]|nr:MAG: serine protease [Flavobacterium sp.]